MGRSEARSSGRGGGDLASDPLGHGLHLLQRDVDELAWREVGRRGGGGRDGGRERSGEKEDEEWVGEWVKMIEIEIE